MTTDKQTDKAAEMDVIGAFKRYGFALIAIPAVAVAVIVGLLVRDVIVRDFGQVFAAGMNGIISEAFDSDSWTSQDPDALAHFEDMIEERMHARLVTAVRIQRLDGTVVFSTDSDEIGERIELEPQAREAVESGLVTSEVVRQHELMADAAGTNLLVVGPVHLEGQPGFVGVLSALKPYGAVEPTVRGAVSTVVAVVLLGALTAYVMLRMLVSRAEGEIDESHERVEQLNERLGQSLSEMERNFIGTLEALNAAVDAKDRYTARHSLHVADYACALGIRLKMDHEIRTLERAGLLHDIGKIGVAEAILQSSERLSEKELQIIKDHCRIGAKIIETVPALNDVVPVVASHHERWDGSGYPDGLIGGQIPMLARLLAVADAFDAMTSDRPYRRAMSVEEARRELNANRGTQFDPKVVDAFVSMIEDGAIVVSEHSSVLGRAVPKGL